MTNQRYLKSMEFPEMLESINRNVLTGDCTCILDAITGDYVNCHKEKMTCRECIERFLKAEKEEY
jgi:hypothetical protein